MPQRGDTEQPNIMHHGVEGKTNPTQPKGLTMLHLLLELCSTLVEPFGRVAQSEEALIRRPINGHRVAVCFHFSGVGPAAMSMGETM